MPIPAAYESPPGFKKPPSFNCFFAPASELDARTACWWATAPWAVALATHTTWPANVGAGATQSLLCVLRPLFAGLVVSVASTRRRRCALQRRRQHAAPARGCPPTALRVAASSVPARPTTSGQPGRPGRRSVQKNTGSGPFVTVRVLPQHRCSPPGPCKNASLLKL